MKKISLLSTVALLIAAFSLSTEGALAKSRKSKTSSHATTEVSKGKKKEIASVKQKGKKRAKKGKNKPATAPASHPAKQHHSERAPAQEGNQSPENGNENNGSESNNNTLPAGDEGFNAENF